MQEKFKGMDRAFNKVADEVEREVVQDVERLKNVIVELKSIAHIETDIRHVRIDQVVPYISSLRVKGHPQKEVRATQAGNQFVSMIHTFVKMGIVNEGQPLGDLLDLGMESVDPEVFIPFKKAYLQLLSKGKIAQSCLDMPAQEFVDWLKLARVTESEIGQYTVGILQELIDGGYVQENTKLLTIFGEDVAADV